VTVVLVVISQANLQWVVVEVVEVLMEFNLYTVMVQVVYMVVVPHRVVMAVVAPFVSFGVPIVHSHQQALAIYKKRKIKCKKIFILKLKTV
jgi:hypothetical protein